MRVKDKVENEYTDAYGFDGLDEGGSLRTALKLKPSVPEDAEIVVGSWRLYLPQYVELADGSQQVETEIVSRFEYLVWSEIDQRWAIYPPKLYEKYFEPAPEEETDGHA